MAAALIHSTSETALHFSDAVCVELLSIVTRMGSLAAASDLPYDLGTALCELSLRHQAFGHWCLRELAPPEHGLAADESSSLGTSAAAWCVAARNLPQALLSHPSWMDSGQPSPMALQLRDSAHLVVRLKLLEQRFASELDHQKTEAIYQFAYGLSHELNNPLANIATRAGVLAQDEPQRGRRDLLQSMVDSAMRGCEMLGDLMLVARPPALELTSVPAAEWAEQLMALATPWAAARGVGLTSRITCQGRMNIDATALREAFWSLIRNAIEAMPDGGQVLLAASEAAEGWLQFEILDQGSGLSPTALAHAWDPYFSGREAGRGLGLGLSKAKRIIELHAGQVKLYNRSGTGCQAVVQLPREPFAAQPTRPS